MSKNISKGGNYALRSYEYCWEVPKIKLFAFFAILIGVPVLDWLVGFITANASMFRVLDSNHLAMINSFSFGGPWSSLLVGLFISGLLLAPFLGFVYSGVVRSVGTKKKFTLKGCFSTGLSDLKSLNYWFLMTVVGAMMLYCKGMIGMSWNREEVLYAVLWCLLCLWACFAAVGYLVKKSNIVGAYRYSFKLILSNWAEILSGAFVWGFVAIAIFMGLEWLEGNVLGRYLSNMMFGIVYSIIPAMWLLAVATSWIIFVSEVCRSSKAK